MGEVFRARDTRLNRDVAIKVLPKDFASDADRLRRFEQEAKTLASLNHPNVLTVFDAGVHEGAPYLVSELLEGGTLREVLSSTATVALPVRKATEFALQIAHGLAAAHGKGVIHRDLKPENIFVTKDGRVKILDFGLAKLKVGLAVPSEPDGAVRTPRPTPDADSPTIVQSTEPGMVLGTPAYMSPEQVRGEPVDHRADTFAFGCVLYELLSGMRAFRGESSIETMNAILKEEPPELSIPNPNLPPALERVVLRCLQKSPERRFQSASDLAFALENISSSSGVAALRDHAPVTTSRWSFAQVLPWVVATLAIGVAVYGLVFARRPMRSGRADNGATLRKFELTFPNPAQIESVDPVVRWLVVSPDGKKLAYINDEGLWIHRLDRGGSPELVRREADIKGLFWSPNSEEIGYFSQKSLYKISIGAGQPSMLCRTVMFASPLSAGGAWFPDGRIVFATGWTETGLYQVSAKGGEATPLLDSVDRTFEVGDPTALPGGGVLVMTSQRVTNTISVWTHDRGLKTLLQSTNPDTQFYRPVYSPTGHVLFTRKKENPGVFAFAFSVLAREHLAYRYGERLGLCADDQPKRRNAGVVSR